MPGIEKPAQGAEILSPGRTGVTLDYMKLGPRNGRYRVRTFLRSNLPYVLSDRIPKGPHDCGNHEWYRQDAQTKACYHCQVGRRTSEQHLHREQHQRTPVSA